jgi:anti-anti-sigma factor
MSDGVEPFQADMLRVKANYDGSAPTIVVEGEFDLTGTERFWAFVSEALAANPRAVIVEASGVEFIDSSGLMALIRAHDAASKAGVEFRVSEPSPPLQRIAEICGVENLISPD